MQAADIMRPRRSVRPLCSQPLTYGLPQLVHHDACISAHGLLQQLVPNNSSLHNVRQGPRLARLTTPHAPAAAAWLTVPKVARAVLTKQQMSPLALGLYRTQATSCTSMDNLSC